VLCPELTILKEYKSDLPDSYWAKFPKFDLPKEPISDINIENFSKLVESRSNQMTVAEQKRAAQSIKDLQCGAKSFQRTVLPACHIPNASNIENFGKEVSDTVASWVKKGFAAGPFTSLPCKNFRVNRVLTIQQNEKVRPVLDLSEPKGASFNSNVCEEKLEKVVMSSSKKFGKTLFEAGKHATFSKFDYVDAYKNVPVQISDLRLQGFEWKNRYFEETRQVSLCTKLLRKLYVVLHTLTTCQ
jgi:hypothetical protein